MGWYADDAVETGMLVPEHPDMATSEHPTAIPDDSFNAHLGDDLEYTAEEGTEGGSEWDGTVLSTAFMKKEPRKSYRLVNEITGQNILVDMGVLMGRKPSQDIPQGAKSVRLVDPTRTVSRNHAAISFDQDGSVWIEDYGSLNGTYVIGDDGERQVVKGTPTVLTAPCKVRIGDQIFDFEATEA
ncbi:FHA domain-containing protein [Bifidobacterium pseudolongum subsp. pseudolongum]|nr:FHA domain-containing protein [Bifidobacterium pseudolongum subsp. pseudolongum]